MTIWNRNNVLYILCFRYHWTVNLLMLLHSVYLLWELTGLTMSKHTLFQVPLDGESLDVAVFCLSLMGTNWIDYVKEANRVLKTG